MSLFLFVGEETKCQRPTDHLPPPLAKPIQNCIAEASSEFTISPLSRPTSHPWNFQMASSL